MSSGKTKSPNRGPGLHKKELKQYNNVAICKRNDKD